MSLLKKRLQGKKSFIKPKVTDHTPHTGLASKFQKRTQSVLDKTYESREDRSKAGGMGKLIFEKDVLEEFGITEIQPTAGDRFFEILPISFDPNIT